MSENLI